MPQDKSSNKVIFTFEVVFFVAAACFGVTALVPPTATVCFESRTAKQPLTQPFAVFLESFKKNFFFHLNPLWLKRHDWKDLDLGQIQALFKYFVFEQIIFSDIGLNIIFIPKQIFCSVLGVINLCPTERELIGLSWFLWDGLETWEMNEEEET